MKKTLISLSFISAILCTNMWGQSYSLTQSFNELNTFLNEYKISSLAASSNIETKNIRATFEYPYLIVSFTDEVIDDFYPTGLVSIGKKQIRTNLKETKISVSTSSGYLSSFTPIYLLFENPSGIETTEQGKKDLVERYTFRGSELTMKKAAELFNQLKEKILTEGYTGKLGTPTSAQATKSKTSTTSSGKSTPLTNKYNHVRYSISYPENWTSMNNVQGANVYIGANDGSIAFTVLSFQTPYSLDEVMAEANSQAALAGWKKTNTTTTLCGVKCYKSTITFTSNGMSVKQIQYTLKKNGFVYNLNFGNDAAKVNANTSLISSIANSFIIK